MNLFRRLFGKFKNDTGDATENSNISLGQKTNVQKEHLASRAVDIEKDRWWLLPHGQQKSGPFTLEELKRAYCNETNTNKLAIRKDGDPDWVKWVNAKVVFPSLKDYFNEIESNMTSQADHAATDAQNLPCMQGQIGKWVKKVVGNPNGQVAQKIPVRDLTKACAHLFQAANSVGIIGKIEHAFNINASAKCQCTATMNGEYLAFLSNIQIANVVTTSRQDVIKCFMNNSCPYCGSTEWTIHWNGK